MSASADSHRPEQALKIQQMLLDRISQPHSQIDESFSLYSSFISAHDNSNYETRLVSAQPVFNAAKSRSERRDAREASLSQSGSPPTVEAYVAYLDWEASLKDATSPAGARLQFGLLARAVHDHPERVEIWDAYIRFARTQLGAAESPAEGADDEETDANVNAAIETLLSVSKRACKACPWSGDLWASYIRAIERAGSAHFDQVERGWNRSS